ncbi:cell division protein FtsW [Marinospirillum celere]|uniref:Probable peptidoglycan glycosyltransferase FtsW n=1 Tax=Marinospirillum celere TaxID=1122252 RepID=A0A1I1G5V9_9GAMM|nr:putative lipid II flippase FtsW [Marinospirillum celere]SFC04570.1 cell division protein FtsW [Marinospirillum celere]
MRATLTRLSLGYRGLLERVRSLLASPEVGKTPVDAWLLFSAIALLLLGWVMVSSASVAIAEAWTGSPQYFAFRQSAFIFLAVIAAWVVSCIPLSLSRFNGHWFLMLAFLLLVVVLFIGREVNGSTRWISLGPFNLQTSEIAKIFLLIYMAGYLVRHLQSVRETFSGFIKPLVLVVLYGGLLIAQPDYGALVVVMAAVMGMVFLAGVRFSHFLLVLFLAVAALALIAVIEPYRMQRLISFTDPWSRQFDSGYQLTQALIAFGRGQWTGLGLGNSVQKLFYLPEAHTDFIFSILAEELGLLGALLTLGLFGLMIARIFLIARRGEKVGHFYAAYLCYGLGVIFAVQLLINLGVNTGLLPTKGLTLPLISYGGSSLLASGIMLGLVFRADLEIRRQAKELKAK